MNKSELVTAVAMQTGLSKKDTEKAINAMLDTVAATLAAGEKVQMAGFGTFEIKTREARIGRNPRTNEAIAIPAASVPAFKPGKALKEQVNK